MVFSDLPEDVRKDILSRVNQNQQVETNIDEPNFFDGDFLCLGFPQSKEGFIVQP